MEVECYKYSETSQLRSPSRQGQHGLNNEVIDCTCNKMNNFLFVTVTEVISHCPRTGYSSIQGINDLTVLMTVLCCSQTIIDLATADVCDHPVYYTLHHHDNSSSVVSVQREVGHMGLLVAELKMDLLKLIFQY